MDLEWKRCDISGQLKAKSKKCTYWVDEQAWTYLSKTGINEQGPYIEQLGQFHNVEDAQFAAQEMYKKE